MSSNVPVRMGLVGAGRIAQAYAEAIASTPQAALVAVADVERDAAEGMARQWDSTAYSSHEALLDEAACEAVLVCTPPVTHERLAIDCLERGVAVLCEKPMAVDSASARRILDAAESAGVPFTMGSKFRFVEDVEQARTFVSQGRIGEAVLFEIAFAGAVDMSARWNSNPSVSGGGVLIDNGTHAVDLIRHLAGPVVEVQACEGKRLQGLAVEDTAQLFVRTADEVVGHVDLSWSLDKDQRPLPPDLRFGGVGARRLEGQRDPRRERCPRSVRPRLRQDRGLPEPDRGLRVRGPDGYEAARLRDGRAVLGTGDRGRLSFARGRTLAEGAEGGPLSAWIHPTAEVEEGVVLGEGTRVWSHVHVRGPSRIGRDCIVGEKSYIAYDVEIADRVKINAFVYLCAGVRVEEGVMIAAGVVFTNDRWPRGDDAGSRGVVAVGARRAYGQHDGARGRHDRGAGHHRHRSRDRALRHGRDGLRRDRRRSRPPRRGRSTGALGRDRVPLWTPPPPAHERCHGRGPRSDGLRCLWVHAERRRRARPLEARSGEAMTVRRRWAIVGGGMLGGTLALRLAHAGHDVTLFEAAPELGGLASPWQLGDIVWDRHYHVTLLSDSSTRGLLRTLDLDGEMRWVKTRTSLFGDGRLVPCSNAIDYLRLPTLGLIDKARLGATILWAARVRDGRPLDHVPVETWLRRLSGERVLEKLWAPLLRSKLGDRYPEASAAFLWATIQRLYAARRSGLKEEMFGYVPGGYARILDSLAAALATAGVEVRLASPVDRMRQEASGWNVAFGEGKEETFERAAVTLTPRRAAKMLPGLAPEARMRLEGVAYQGIVCASVLLDRPLADAYLTYLVDPDLPFTAVVEMSAFVDPAELGGHGLVYLPLYLPASDERFRASDDEIRTRFLAGLRRVHPSATPDRIKAFRVSRVAEVFPFPVLGYTDKLPSSHLGPGLHWVSSAPDRGRHLERRCDGVGRRSRRAGPAGQRWSRVGAAMKPWASLSLDLDNQWSYMKTHGDAAWESLPSYLDTLVPRALELLDDLGLTITFFVVGQDAAVPANAAPLRALQAAGHEIANHSFHHEPWLHLYTDDELERELAMAEDAIGGVTGATLRGFRGPGYSLSLRTLELLEARGYRYDATTLPTWIGPFARAYYFKTARLTPEERAERSGLFGHLRDGLQPLRPHHWRLGDRRLLEIPVTTLPLARVPFTSPTCWPSAAYSEVAGRRYFRAGLSLCRALGVEPSILLHPLDLLGADDVSALGSSRACSSRVR